MSKRSGFSDLETTSRDNRVKHEDKDSVACSFLAARWVFSTNSAHSPWGLQNVKANLNISYEYWRRHIVLRRSSRTPGADVLELSFHRKGRSPLTLLIIRRWRVPVRKLLKRLFCMTIMMICNDINAKDTPHIHGQDIPFLSSFVYFSPVRYTYKSSTGHHTRQMSGFWSTLVTSTFRTSKRMGYLKIWGTRFDRAVKNIWISQWMTITLICSSLAFSKLISPCRKLIFADDERQTIRSGIYNIILKCVNTMLRRSCPISSVY